MSERALLMLDVDGVLNPWMMPRDDLRAAGFRRWRLPTEPGPEERTYNVWLNPIHGKWLQGLIELYDLVWCTTWWPHADEIAERVGLPLDLPAVPLPHPRPVDPPGMTWKTPYVRAYAAGRSVAWLDDDFELGDRDERALTQLDAAEGGFATVRPAALSVKLMRCQPWVGLTRRHVDALGVWASAGFPAEEVPPR